MILNELFFEGCICSNLLFGMWTRTGNDFYTAQETYWINKKVDIWPVGVILYLMIALIFIIFNST